MRIFFNRLRKSPLLALEILAATFFITILNLALPLYVILLLRKYLASGFQGTLITLTAGVVMAVLLQAAFKFLRTRMSLALNTRANTDLGREYLGMLLRGRAGALEQLPREYVQAIPGKLQNVQNAYSGPTLTALLDAPFSLLYLLATFLLSPLLGIISALFFVLVLALGTFNIHASQKEAQALNREVNEHNRDVLAGAQGVDTVRVFGGEERFLRQWDKQLDRISRVRDRLSGKQDLHQNVSQSGSMFMSIGLYSLGAPLVMTGNLTVATLIGANILASRAYQNLARALQSGYALKRANRALRDLENLRGIPERSSAGSALSGYKGGLRADNLGFAYPRAPKPVFQAISFHLAPKQTVVISGAAGSGKSTLCRLLAGLLDPVQGEILCDGVNLRQLSLAWWRRQLIYLPESYSFVAGTLRENIVLPRPEIEEGELNQILRLTGLRPVLDGMAEGLKTRITPEGSEFPPGTRKRLALARSLTIGGQLVLLDEPDSGLDHFARNDLYALLNHLHGSGRTILVFSNDPKIIRGANLHYRLEAGKMVESGNSSAAGPEV